MAYIYTWKDSYRVTLTKCDINIKWHKNCVSSYTSKSHIKRHLKHTRTSSQIRVKVLFLQSILVVQTLHLLTSRNTVSSAAMFVNLRSTGKIIVVVDALFYAAQQTVGIKTRSNKMFFVREIPGMMTFQKL